MNIEVEYKFLIKDERSMIKRLGRPKIKKQYQSNVMFDNANGLMQKTDGRVRVRSIGKNGQKILTYKKPLPAKNSAKQETEYEINFLDHGQQIENILQAMDFLPTTSYERYQTKWRVGKTAVTLDEYPFATFLEIEGEQSKIEKMAIQLGFELTDGLTEPADTLFQKWRTKNNLPFKSHMKFDDYDQ